MPTPKHPEKRSELRAAPPSAPPQSVIGPSRGKSSRMPAATVLGRLMSDLIAATFGLTLVAAAVMPAMAQEREAPDATATVQEIAVEPDAGNASAARSPADHPDGGIDWRPVLSESLLFLTAQHLTRFTEDRTANRLGGPFVNDWFDSVRSLNRFNDGGHIFTNWFAHPMMGSVTTHILGQNDPEYSGEQDRFRQPLLAGEGQAVHLCHCLFDTIRDRAAFGILPGKHTSGLDRPLAHVHTGNRVVDRRGPGGAARSSADACEASDLGQHPDGSPQPDEELCQRAGVQAALGLRGGELLLSARAHRTVRVYWGTQAQLRVASVGSVGTPLACRLAPPRPSRRGVV